MTLALGGAKQRSVLALLLLARGEVVSLDRLVDQLWGESPPPAGVTSVHGYVSRLRRLLEPGNESAAEARTIVTRAPGYLLQLEPGQLDLDRFERLSAEGRGALGEDDATTAAGRFRAALALWRGRPLADLENEPFARESLSHLEELRLAVVEDRIAADLALGHHREVVPELLELTRGQPLSERLHELLMLALYRCGRQADALATYAELRRRLVDELGIEPSKPLRQLEQSILNQNRELDAPRRPRGAGPGPPPDDAPASGRRPLLRPAAAAAAAVIVAAAVVLLLTLGASSSRAVSVGPNTVVRIDPRSTRVVADVPVGLTPTSVSAGDGAVWTLNADDQTLSRIDPGTNLAQTFGSGGVPTDVAAGGGAVWVGNGERSTGQYVGPVATTVSRINPDTRAIYATVALPPPGSTPSNLNQNHIAVGPSGVWVVGPDASVSRVDLRTVAITATIHSVSAAAVATGDGQVWVLETGHQIARIDPRTNGVTARIPIVDTSPSSIAVGGGSVWVTDPDDGTLLRVDASTHRVVSTIPVGVGASAVAYGEGSVWVVNALRGTLTRVDPTRNRAVATVDLGNTPRQVTVGSGGVWVSVAGAAAASTPAASAEPVRSALPAATCGSVFYGGPGQPDRLIVSDFPLRGGPRLTTDQMSAAIEYVLRAHHFEAGRFRVGYQSCDDSTSQTGTFDEGKCASNARLYAATPAVIGEIGPFNSGCAYVQIPILDAAKGPFPMISPTNSDVPLTRPDPRAAPGNFDRLYPSGRRNYTRIYPTEDIQAAANALFLHALGTRSVAVLSDGGYGEAEATFFRMVAKRLGLTVVASVEWDPRAGGYAALASGIKRLRPDAIFLSGLLDSNGGAVVRALRGRLPNATLLGTDGFLPISGLFATAGQAAKGMYVSLPGLTTGSIAPQGRFFVRDFAATQPGQGVDQAAVYAAQAAEVLLDAIAQSDGTRGSVTRQLFTIRVRHGIIGDFGFDRRGDVTPAPITILRAARGGGANSVMSYQGAAIVRVVRPPRSLIR
jgi:DNA-binding SARP family transcriptional activator/ABC-type branched-subunit amino acid transport system substrate-binding protein/streptogramin lyase